jgi:hypothetical protein
MDNIAWELILAIVGSGVISGFLVWMYNAVKNSGVKDFKSDDLFERVGLIETRQESHEEEYRTFREQIQTEFSSMEKKVSDTNRDLEMRLTKMEIDLSHIKEMQVIQHQAQVETSKDIKQLLSRTTKE